MNSWPSGFHSTQPSLSIIIFTFLTNVAFLHVSSLDTQGWGVSPRGAGYLFGSDVVTQVQ